MNRQKHLVISAILGILPLMAHAQVIDHSRPTHLPLQTATWLTRHGHYYGSSTELRKLAPGQPHAEAKDAQALELINKYRLCGDSETAQTVSEIESWLKDNPTAADADRLTAMAANLKVRQGRDSEALDIYKNTDITNLGQEETDDALFYEALANVRTGNLKAARTLLLTMDDDTRHEVDIIYLTSYIDYSEGNYKDALAGFKTIEHSAEYGSTAYLYLADTYLNMSRPAQALEVIKRHTGDYANADIRDHSQRIEGEAQYDLGNYEECIRKLAPLDKSDAEKDNRKRLYKLGMSYYKLGQHGKAAPALAASAATAADAMAQNAWLHAGISYLNNGNSKQAMMAFQQAQQMTADETVREEAMYNYALTLHDGTETGFGESVGVFENFMNQYPSSKHADKVSKHLTEVYLTTNNYTAALSSINKIKNPGRDIQKAKQAVLFKQGCQKFVNADYTASIDCMTKAVNLGKLDAKAYNEALLWRGDAELRTGSYSQAATDLRRYISGTTTPTGTNTTKAYYGLGYAYFKQKDYQQALGAFRQCVSSSATTPATGGTQAAITADAYNRMGDCLFAQRKYDDALTMYQNAADTDATQGDYTTLQQGLIYGLKGDYTKKAQVLSQISQRYGTSQYASDALYEQGRAYVQNGDKQSALDTYNTLISRFPQSANARKAANEVGMVLFDMGRTDEAIAAYNKVINDYPNTEEAHTALSNLKDIYGELGRIDEYKAAAQKAGQKLSAEEIQGLLSAAASKAMSDNKYSQAYTYYGQLLEQASDDDTRTSALQGMLQAAHKAGDDTAVREAATAILSDSKAPSDLASEARMYRADALAKAGETQKAIADYQALAQYPATEYGARSTVTLAQYAYDTSQYAEAEQILLGFIDSGTPHAYWLARGFILLSDVYSKTDRKVEARQYLLSLKSNYTESEEINGMVAERLKNL